MIGGILGGLIGGGAGGGGGGGGLFGPIMQIGAQAANNTQRSMEDIGHAVMDVIASRSENPYPHAMHVGRERRAKKERNDQRAHQSGMQASSQLAQALLQDQDRQWRSGEAEKGRQYQEGQGDKSFARQLSLLAAQSGAPQGGNPLEGIANLAAEDRGRAVTMDDLRTQTAREQLNRLRQTPLPQDPNQLRQQQQMDALGNALIQYGVDPNTIPSRTPAGLQAILADVNRQALEADAAARGEKKRREDEMHGLRREDMESKLNLRRANEEWLRNQGMDGGGMSGPLPLWRDVWGRK